MCSRCESTALNSEAELLPPQNAQTHFEGIFDSEENNEHFCRFTEGARRAMSAQDVAQKLNHNYVAANTCSRSFV